MKGMLPAGQPMNSESTPGVRSARLVRTSHTSLGELGFGLGTVKSLGSARHA